MTIQPTLNGINGHGNGHTNGHARPRVFALNPLRSQALTLAQEHFDLVEHDSPKAHLWREQAEGLLVVGAAVGSEDMGALEQSGKIRYISKQGTGVDRIDIAKAGKMGVPVMNTPGVNAQAVAELAFGLIVSLARQIPSIDQRIKRGESITKAIGWTGQSLYGKTLGVIGGGNIGLAVAKMFHGAFKGQIVIYDPYLKSLDHWKSEVSPNVSLVSDLDDLLTSSDIVTIHVPLTASTANMIGAPQFKIMKKSCILVNTARGGIINEQELVEALDQGEIFAAGLDAVVDEPPNLNKQSALCASDRVVLLPHIGAATEAVQEATCLAMVQNLVNAFEGNVQNRVC